MKKSSILQLFSQLEQNLLEAALLIFTISISILICSSYQIEIRLISVHL